MFVGTVHNAPLRWMLASALGHETEHVRALDPLRYLILQLALAVNPFEFMNFMLDPVWRRPEQRDGHRQPGRTSAQFIKAEVRKNTAIFRMLLR